MPRKVKGTPEINWPLRAADLAAWGEGKWNGQPTREQTQWMANRIEELELRLAALELSDIPVRPAPRND